MGHVGERERGRRAFQDGSFAPLSQQNVTGAHLGCVFSKAEYLRKVGTCSEISKGPRKSGTRKLKDMPKLVLGHLSSSVWFL